MPTADAKNIGRLIRAATAALALALLLSRVTAGPAGAEPQGPGTVNANAFIDWCVANGGSPDADYDGSYGKIVGVCWFSDRSKLQCNFWLDGSVDCYTKSPSGVIHAVNPPDGTGIAPPLVRPPSGLGYHGGHGTLQFNGGGSPIGQTGSGGTTLHTASASGKASGMADKHAGAHGQGGKTPKGHHGHGGKK